jgi:uncharacterized protein (TIGR03437 family)
LLSATILFSLVSTSAAFGYIRLTTYPPQSPNDPPSVPMARPDFAAIQFYISSALVPGLQSSASGKSVTVLAPGSDPVGAARTALATWNASGANIKFLPLQSTATSQSSYPPSASDGQNVILLATNTADVSYVGGAIAITNLVYTTGSGSDPYNGNLTVSNGSIVDSDILLNPAFQFNTDGTGSGTPAAILAGNTTQDLQAVLTHELGHSLGSNHTGLLGAAMFQFAEIDQRFLSVDDVTFVNTVYPPATFAATVGTISGRVTTSTGGGVAYGMLTIIDTAQNLTLGGLTNSDGTFSVQVPPGNYVIYAEPFNAIVQAGNLYLTTQQAALSSTFQTTFYGSFATPTSVNVAAGSTTTVNFPVTAGSTTLNLPYVRLQGAAPVTNVSIYQINGPLQVASGQAVDFIFGGPGYDGTLTLGNIKVLGGGGITVTGIKPDTSTNLTGIQRLSLNVPAMSSSTPVSIVITKGGITLSMSAVLVVTPPTPVFISASLVSAASYQSASGGGTVTPGGIYALFTPTGSPATLGPATPVVNGGYDPYGNLPSSLAGVSVTFDGVPAPLFFVYNGQINLQVPFEVAGKTSTNVVVSYFGAANQPVAVPVFPIQPAFFTFTAGGTDAVIANPDGSINSSTRPALQGKTVVIYGTGVGVTSLGAAGYGLKTGAPAPGFPSGYTGNFNCSIGSATFTNTVPATFGGWTPSAVGLAQWNVQVPTGLTGTLNLLCTDIATGTKTQLGTIYVN